MDTKKKVRYLDELILGDYVNINGKWVVLVEINSQTNTYRFEEEEQKTMWCTLSIQKPCVHKNYVYICESKDECKLKLPSYEKPPVNGWPPPAHRGKGGENE